MTKMRIQRRGGNAHEWELYRGNGSIGIEWYFKETTNLPTSVMLYHLEPGAEEGQHYHLAGDEGSCSERSSDEIYVVTRGEVVISADDRSEVLQAGDAFYAPHGMRHGVRNDTDAVAQLILIFGPAGKNPFAQTGVEPFERDATSSSAE